MLEIEDNETRGKLPIYKVGDRISGPSEEKAVETRRSAPKIAIVIPTLNEHKAVGNVLDGVKNVMDGYEYRMLVVDGHSVDGTDDIAREKGAEVIYQRGKGYGEALKTGFFHARKWLDAGVIVMIDADLSYDPKDIPELLAPILKDEADLVVGNRFAGMQKGAMPFVNRIGNKLLSLFAKVTLRLNIYDTQSGIRAFKSKLLDSMNLVARGMPFAIEMLTEALSSDARIHETPVSYRPRVGKTKLSPIKDGGRILGITLRLMFDTQPLLFFGSIGIVLGMVGLFLHAVTLPTVVYQYLFMIGAIQFFTLGLVIAMIKRLGRSRTRKSWKS
ncbi:MAG: glycosyltransferase [Candidatus Bathyarchaeota archaeon]|nr:MAG: glycosyltransferase [Candidatus Bathyarchaeota archaeon]